MVHMFTVFDNFWAWSNYCHTYYIYNPYYQRCQHHNNNICTGKIVVVVVVVVVVMRNMQTIDADIIVMVLLIKDA